MHLVYKPLYKLTNIFPLKSMRVIMLQYTDKKENQIFLIYKEIQCGAVAKSYMRKAFLIYEEAVSHI